MPQNPPIFGPRGPANPGEIITNATAPVIKMDITLDNRYTPPKLSWNVSQAIPGKIAIACLLTMASQFNQMEMQAEMEMQKGAKPPDLPPAPPVS